MIRYAFLGPMASGKTTVSDKMMEHFNAKKISFAVPVKEIARKHFGMKEKDRRLLQVIGMTGRILNPDTWINMLKEKIIEGESYVIDDVRFPNECKELKELGFTLVWLEVPKSERIKRLRSVYGDKAEEHIENMSSISEHSIDKSMADIVWKDKGNDILVDIINKVNEYS